MEDTLLKIKKEEEALEKELESFRLKLEEEKEKRISFWKKKISESRKMHRERKENLEKEMAPLFSRIDNELQADYLGRAEELKRKAKGNFESFSAKIRSKMGL